MPTYKDIDYALVRSGRRKTVSIFVERDGSVTVRVPEHLPDAEIEQIVESKRAWIYKHLAEWRDLNTPQVQRDYVGGETFLYLGRRYRLKWVDEQAQPLVLRGGYFLLRRDPKTQAAPAEAFKAWYIARGRERIPGRVLYYATQLGVNLRQVRVMELQHRWASCSAKGYLNFHWRCIMAPVSVLDYIIVHELAHLIVPDHSPAFWNEVDKILPDYRERQVWLRMHGAGMDL